MAPAKARAAVQRHLARRALAEASRAELLPALRKLGAERFGSVARFAEAIAADAGLSAITARNGLYNHPSPTVTNAALRLLGFVDMAAAA